MAPFRPAIYTLALLPMFMLATGCAGDRFDEKKEKLSAINMAGRWMLTSPNRGQCGMNFSGAPKATEGTIRPEGGCPGNFFTSRTWALVEGTIVIKDHNGEQLVHLSPSNTSGASIWFEGQAATGERVMLARQ